jgi:hypothetical protein
MNEILGNNYIAANKQSAINTTGEILKVGDVVGHQDLTVGLARIDSFEIDEETAEIKANTEKGYAHIDFIHIVNPIGVYMYNKTKAYVYPTSVEGYSGYCFELDEDLYDFEFTKI